MISCIEWVPKGVANPTPKKYEMSAVEIELLENQAKLQAALDEPDEDDDSTGDNSDGDDEPRKSTIQLPKIDPSTLPADLRMDEYTDDEDDDDQDATANQEARAGSMIGRMLVGNDDDSEMNDDHEEESDDDASEELHDQHVHNSKSPIEKDSDADSDDDEDDDDALDDIPDTREFMPVDIDGLQAMGISHAGASALLHPNHDLNDDDDDDDDDDSDADDHNLTPDDAILVIAKTEDDFASLEVHVYEERTGNLFVHHDIPLPSFPLCLAHGDINHDGCAGNYIAVGTFSPGIEIWNLDVLQVLEPTCILGGEDTSAADELMKINMTRAATGKKLKKKLQQQKQNGVGGAMRPGSHSDAVMALSWSKIHRQVIASGSADKTVKIWDVTKATADGGNVATFKHHRDKVQSVVWHPSEGTLLATGSYDRTLALLDVRGNGSSSQNVKRVKISADCESLSWDPHHSQYLTCATEDGVLSTWDVRNFEKPVWSFVVAEYGGVSDLSYNPSVPGMLATCSTNKTVTLWDTFNKDLQPSLAPPLCCGNKSMEVGKLYTLAFYPSSPWLLGCGGSGNELALWDMNSDDSIQRRFGDRVGKAVVLNGTTATDETTKEVDFEAMMAIQDSKPEENKTPSKSNKKKGKKKPAHKKRK